MNKDFEWLKWVGLFTVISILGAIVFQAQNGKNKESIKKENNLVSLIPISKINQENAEFVKNYIPQIEKQCLGLIKYKDDWDFEEITNRGFTIKVSNKPKNDKLVEYNSFGNRCFFDLSDDNRTVFIPKRACASLCRDQLIDDSSYKVNIHAIKGKNDSLILTQQESQSISGSLGAMMVWLGKPDENQKIVDKILNIQNKEESDKYLLSRYLEAKSEMETRAISGDYQFQRNVAYMYSTDPEKLGGNRKTGCVWYLSHITGLL